MSPPFVFPVDDAYAMYLRDESRRVGEAESISFPQSEADIVRDVQAAAAQGRAITVQGARTGVVAGAVPDGGHILNLSRMTALTGLRRDGDSGAFCLTVEPGATLAQIRTALETRNFDITHWTEESRKALGVFQQAGAWFFPPDPTEDSASIGGMVAANSSGARSFLYGATREHIQALRVVLADGSVLVLRRGEQRAIGRDFRLVCENGREIAGRLAAFDTPSIKSVAGFYTRPDMDLIDLFIGMEGSLGICAQIELRLSPLPPSVWGALWFLPSQESALAFVESLRQRQRSAPPADADSALVAIEYFNDHALGLLRRHRAEHPDSGLAPEAPESFLVAVYAEFQGPDEDTVADRVMEAMESALAVGGDEDATWLGSDPDTMKRLKDFRHAVPEIVNMTIDERRRSEPTITKLGTDMSVPDDQLAAVMALYDEALAEAGLESVIFGHIGSNHVHVNILPRNLDEYGRGVALYQRWATEIVAMGGSVSAEHGIGKIKRPMLAMMLGPEGLAEMQRLKQLFDPRGLLNPGNLFEYPTA